MKKNHKGSTCFIPVFFFTKGGGKTIKKAITFWSICAFFLFQISKYHHFEPRKLGWSKFFYKSHVRFDLFLLLQIQFQCVSRKVLSETKALCEKVSCEKVTNKSGSRREKGWFEKHNTGFSFYFWEEQKAKKASLNEFHSDVGDVSESDYLLLRFLFNENRYKSNCGWFMHFQQRALKLSSLITELKEVWWKVGNRLQTFVCSFSDKGNMITLAPRNRVLWTKNTAKEKHTSALMQLFISICQNVVNNLV